MKRACYEWGWMLFGGIAIVSFALWVASTITDRASARINVDGRSIVRIREGFVEITNTTSGYESYYFYNVFTPPLPERVFAAPGLKFRSVNTGDPEAIPFELEFSLLILTGAAAILAAICFWQYRRTIRQTAKQLAS